MLRARRCNIKACMLLAKLAYLLETDTGQEMER